MGIDALDIVFRIEKRYNVKVDMQDWVELANHRTPGDLTAGELHFLIGASLQESNQPVPRSLWNGLRVILAQSLAVSPQKIKPESWLIKDLGMS